MPAPAPRIGTLREKPLHAALKEWYAIPGDMVEAPVDGFVIDLVRGDLLIEVQTRGFSSIKRKLTSLLESGHPVRVVHPIPIDKWIVKVDPDGAVLGRRLSPRHGVVADVFAELVSFPELLAEPRFELEVLLVVEEERRHHTPGRAWRRNGWTVLERGLVEVAESMLLRDGADLASLLPEGLPEPFTTAELAGRLRRPRRSAQQMAYCLRKAGVLVETGRRGNEVEYRVG